MSFCRCRIQAWAWMRTHARRLNRELDTISSDQQGTGYGGRNVNDKIKIVYGSRYGVTIESAMGEGTVVTLRIGKKGETSDESDYL